MLSEEKKFIMSHELLKALIKEKKSEVALILMKYSRVFEIKGKILDPLGRFGNFIYFDEFDDPYPLPSSLCLHKHINFDMLLQQFVKLEEVQSQENDDSGSG